MEKNEFLPDKIRSLLDNAYREVWDFLGEINGLPLSLQLAKMVNKIQELLLENLRLKQDLEDLKKAVKK